MNEEQLDETEKCYLIYNENGYLDCNYNHKSGAWCLLTVKDNEELEEIMTSTHNTTEEDLFLKQWTSAKGSNRELIDHVKNIVLRTHNLALQQVLEKAEDYKISKEAVKVNKLGADYIFWYDLKLAITSLQKE